MKRMAPIQASCGRKIPAGEVPWEVHALAAKEYNRHHNQSAESLSDRGGFSWDELIACLRGDYTGEGCAQARRDLEGVMEKP